MDKGEIHFNGNFSEFSETQMYRDYLEQYKEQHHIQNVQMNSRQELEMEENSEKSQSFQQKDLAK